MPLEPKKFSIVAQTEQKMQKDKKKAPQIPQTGRSHAQIISETLARVDDTKDAQQINGVPRLVRSGMTIYDINMVVSGKPKRYVAFVYPGAFTNSKSAFAITEFLTKAAYANTIVGLVSITPDCTIVKNYKG